MFSNYFRSTIRNIVNQKLYAFINVLGLAIGLAACMIIILFVKHETSYDQNLPELDRLYRVEAQTNIPGRQSNDAPTYFGTLYDLLPGDYSEVEHVVRLQGRGGTIVKGADSFPEQIDYTDPEFFDVFQFPFIEGDPKTALDDLSSVVLTQEMARKHLGDGPWLGKTIEINDVYQREHKVTGIIEDLPSTSHLDVSIIVPIDRKVYDANNFGGSTDLDRWNGLPFFVYLKLKEGATIDNLKATINDWVDKYFPDNIARLVNIKGSELFTPRLMPVKDIHLYSPAQFDMKPRGSLTTLYSYSGVALLILLIACINFMNLATARSTLRAQEVAVRKVMGASRKQLLVQFETESLAFSFLALIAAYVITEFTLPYFSEYTGRLIDSSELMTPFLLITASTLALLVGLLAGLHPAIILANTRPARVLMSNQSSSPGGSKLRTFLVLLQFTISAALIIMTLVIYLQTDYARNVDMGYDRTHKYALRGLRDPQVQPQVETFTNRIRALDGVKAASITSFAPGDGSGSGLSLKVPGVENRIIIFYRSVYPEFFSQFNLKPLAGRLLEDPRDRSFIPDDPEDMTEISVNVLINMLAARELGYNTAEKALGGVYYRGRENQITSTIVGVIPDVHFGSPRQKIRSEIMMMRPADNSTVLITYDPLREETLGPQIDALAKEMFPGVEIERQYVDEQFANQFRFEVVQGTLLAMFAGLAILVACMGLFGLSAFTIARRTKEIGIRKVMGASSKDIIMMLLRQFSKPVIIANVIAWPIGWFVIGEWIQAFEHRISLVPTFSAVAVVALLATLGIAWSTVATHAVKVARTKPIKALRYE